MFNFKKKIDKCIDKNNRIISMGKMTEVVVTALRKLGAGVTDKNDVEKSISFIIGVESMCIAIIKEIVPKSAWGHVVKVFYDALAERSNCEQSR